VQERYGCEFAAVLSHAHEMVSLASGGISVLRRHPDHAMTALYETVAPE
jgi:hypothetical protein